ncbi:MAG: imelysin family protein [Rhodospirillales bacterium]
MNRRQILYGLIIGLAGSLITPTPAHAAGKAIDYEAVNAAIVKDHLLPRYHGLTGKTAQLAQVAGTLCPDVAPKTLDAVKTAFHDALDAWQEIEHLRQGPPATLEAHIRVKFWPDRRSLVDKHLARLMANKNPDILKPDVFGHVSIAVQGFPAMERLLFADNAQTRLKDTTGPVSPCAVVQAIAVNLHAIARELETRWTRDPAAGRPAKRVTTDLFNDLATGLGAVGDLKLGAALGSDGGYRPRRAENQLSGRALRNVAHNLVALEDLYDGLATAPAASLAGTPEDTLIRRQFTQLIADTKAMGPSIKALLKTDQDALRLKELKGRILKLREQVIVNVSAALNLVLGFNALDGD